MLDLASEMRDLGFAEAAEAEVAMEVEAEEGGV
jgi:hypothetical protein